MTLFSSLWGAMTIHVTNIEEEVETDTAQLPIDGYHFQPRFYKAPLNLYRNGLKRVFDAALVLICLPVALPLIAIMALLVSLDGHSPFYRQDRVGQDGRIFRMWKLRSMVPNAQAMLETHLKGCDISRAEWDQTQKLKRDPRVTPIGRMLRKSSMDELPQLFNVLLGDMSLVGPRPMMISQKVLYPGRAYYRMRPGITGLWQITDRNDCRFSKRADFDDTYLRQMSFFTDLSILLKTVRVVLRGTGH